MSDYTRLEWRFGDKYGSVYRTGPHLADLTPYHIRGHDAYTWRSRSSSYGPGRIDYIV